VSDNGKQDRRIERTQASLWDAMFALLHEETWREINVSKICKRANVARSSFYLHFQNKQELLDYGFEMGILFARENIFEQKVDNNTYATLYWLTNHIYEGRKFLSHKLQEDEYIFTRFQEMICTLFVEELEIKKVEADVDSISFVMGGVFSILQKWILAGYPDSPESMALKLNKLTSRVI
jgi:AcrR family transcriptional regulator